MDLYNNIVKQYWITKITPTHILTYDLKCKYLPIDIYSKLDELIMKKYPSAIKWYNTTWEIRTTDSCESIKNSLVPVFNGYWKLKVYQIFIIDTAEHNIDSKTVSLGTGMSPKQLSHRQVIVKPKAINSPLIKVWVPLKKTSQKFNLFDWILSK